MTLEANVFLSLLFLPNLQWITSCLLHAHLSHLATRSPKLEDPEPTVVLSFRSLSHVWIFCNSMDCILPGFSVHGISQASVLESAAVSFSRGSSWHRDRTHVSYIGKWILYHWDLGSPGHRTAEHYLWLQVPMMYVWGSTASASHCRGGGLKVQCSWHFCCDSLPIWGQNL